MTSWYQMVSHTAMKLHAWIIALIALTFSLIPPIEAYAEADAVALNTVAADTSLHSSGMRISPETVAAMMRQIHYAKEGFFTSDSVIRVFRKHEIADISSEISAVASELKSQQAIAFKTDGARVRGYVFLSGQQAIWHIVSIDGRPAERVTNLTEENAALDDPESIFENRIEESYWKFSPRQGQSFYRNRPDWLNVPIKHVAATPRKAAPVRRAATAWVDTSRSASTRTETKAGARSRIETLHGLLSKKLITDADYKEKIVAILAEYKATHPSIEEHLGLLLQLKEKGWIDKAYFQTRKKELLEEL